MGSMGKCRSMHSPSHEQLLASDFRPNRRREQEVKEEVGSCAYPCAVGRRRQRARAAALSAGEGGGELVPPPRAPEARGGGLTLLPGAPER
ncbi:hypothetical protein EJB05_24517 [Eragrostis curvula]|uniref:Uncharacterized protein n=1 Tax=Eragrostis curvula TaxID=38414 RepID=A0A5J9VBA6_9POAL|nr:hypothetical protein EJB05_24517 [Eragrostis curvula]